MQSLRHFFKDLYGITIRRFHSCDLSSFNSFSWTCSSPNPFPRTPLLEFCIQPSLWVTEFSLLRTKFTYIDLNRPESLGSPGMVKWLISSCAGMHAVVFRTMQAPCNITMHNSSIVWHINFAGTRRSARVAYVTF